MEGNFLKIILKQNTIDIIVQINKSYVDNMEDFKANCFCSKDGVANEAFFFSCSHLNNDPRSN